MPKKPPRNNPKGRELRTVHTSRIGAPLLLQRIIQRARVELPGQAAGADPAAAQRVGGLRAALPPELGAHVADIIIRESELVLFADSAAWAARLRLWLAEHAGLAGARATVRVRQHAGTKPAGSR